MPQPISQTDEKGIREEIPDVIGYFLEDALPLIHQKGFAADSILVTKPLKATEPLGKARVIRLSLLDKAKLRVVVAYQDYGKGGVQNGLQNN